MNKKEEAEPPPLFGCKVFGHNRMEFLPVNKSRISQWKEEAANEGTPQRSTALFVLPCRGIYSGSFDPVLTSSLARSAGVFFVAHF